MRIKELPGLPVSRRQAAGISLFKECQGSWVGLQLLELQPQADVRFQHFSEVAQQSEAGDVGTGMDAFALMQGLDQLVLALIHRLQCAIEIVWLGSTCHRCSEEHAGAERSAEQQRIPCF